MKKTFSILMMLCLLLGLAPLGLAEEVAPAFIPWQEVKEPRYPWTLDTDEAAAEALSDTSLSEVVVDVSTTRPLPRPGFKRYTNKVLSYAVDLPHAFEAEREETRKDKLTRMRGIIADPGEKDYVWDFRAWGNEQDAMAIEITVKNPTYASFDEEVALYPGYVDMIKDGYEAQGALNLRAAYEGTTVHDLPAGQMLENSIVYSAGGRQYHELYLDLYKGDREYIISLIGMGYEYETLKELLLQVGASFYLND